MRNVLILDQLILFYRPNKKWEILRTVLPRSLLFRVGLYFGLLFLGCACGEKKSGPYSLGFSLETTMIVAVCACGEKNPAHIPCASLSKPPWSLPFRPRRTVIMTAKCPSAGTKLSPVQRAVRYSTEATCCARARRQPRAPGPGSSRCCFWSCVDTRQLRATAWSKTSGPHDLPPHRAACAAAIPTDHPWTWSMASRVARVTASCASRRDRADLVLHLHLYLYLHLVTQPGCVVSRSAELLLMRLSPPNHLCLVTARRSSAYQQVRSVRHYHFGAFSSVRYGCWFVSVAGTGMTHEHWRCSASAVRGPWTVLGTIAPSNYSTLLPSSLSALPNIRMDIF